MPRASSAQLLQHCHRTYAWGMIPAEFDGRRADAELYWVATFLHDLALTARHRHCLPTPCFDARATMLGDAVSLHLNVTVPPEHGPEAQLLQAAAALDVIGARYWDLAPATIAAAVARRPRLEMKRVGYPSFEAEAHRGTRTKLLARWLQFGTLVRHSPFAE